MNPFKADATRSQALTVAHQVFEGDHQEGQQQQNLLELPFRLLALAPSVPIANARFDVDGIGTRNHTGFRFGDGSVGNMADRREVLKPSPSKKQSEEVARTKTTETTSVRPMSTLVVCRVKATSLVEVHF